MRTFGGAACRRVTTAIACKRYRQVACRPALEHDRGACKFVFGHARQALLERINGTFARRRECGSMLGHCELKRRQPRFIPAIICQQLVPCPHRCIVARGVMGMGRLKREDQPIEEPAAVPGAAGEEPVHCGGQPQNGQPFAQRVDRGRRAVDPHLSPFGVRGLCAGADVTHRGAPRSRTRLRHQSAPSRRAAPREGRVRASAAKPLRAGSSCPLHFRRRARPNRAPARVKPRHRSGNRLGRGG